MQQPREMRQSIEAWRTSNDDSEDGKHRENTEGADDVLESIGSCKRYGCADRYDRARRCQCNSDCVEFKSCCVDYQDVCGMDLRRGKGSCADYGCVGYHKDHHCQCNPGCVNFGSCCHDARTQCGNSSTWHRVERMLRQARKRHEERKRAWLHEQQVLSHPKRICSPLEIGFAVEVRDTAISHWLPAKVVGLKPVVAQPDGWDTGFLWSAYRHNGVICRPRSQQMVTSTGHNSSSQGDEACLCLFDVDRTLTCKQGQASRCPGVKEVHGVRDTAYGGGPLVLSELAQRLTDTFCGQCYRGVVSAGHVSGLHSKERKVLLDALGGPRWTLSDVWSAATPNVSSMLVIGAHDYYKQ